MNNHMEIEPPMYILGEVLHKINQIGIFTRLASPDMQLFGYKLVVCGMNTTGVGYAMEEAKQVAAENMLHLLARSGYEVPPPYGFDDEPDKPDENTMLLRKFCLRNKLDLCFVPVTEPGVLQQPAHFTVSVTVYSHGVRQATATTRKQAQELVSRVMITYLETIYGAITL